MKKLLFTLILILGLGLSFNVNADTVEWFFEYGIASEVNNRRLNGNIRNLINWANGGISNINLKDGFRMIEILGALPLAEIPGRGVYLTTEDVLYLDDGTNWWGTPTYQGAPSQGDILYFNGTNWVRLAAGTDGQYLKTQGSGANPTWDDDIVNEGDAAGGDLTGTYPDPTLKYRTSESLYYALWDSTVVLAFGDSEKKFGAFALTGLTGADVVAGQVSPCFDFDGSNDYVEVAHNSSQASMEAMTAECWFYKDTTGDNYLITNKTDNYFELYMTNTNIVINLATSDGTETVNLAHDLADNGTGAWVHVVFAWNNAGPGELYVNGVDKGDGDDAGNGYVSDSANGIYIGAKSDAATKWNGKIDGVRILRRKMGATEALARYNEFD